MNMEVPVEDRTDYEVLSHDTVKQMHQRFMDVLEEKAKKIIPEDIEDPASIMDSLKTLLIACARKSIVIGADDLAEIARTGIEEIDRRTSLANLSVHAKSPTASEYPSPALFPDQEQSVALAAKERKDTPAVLDVFDQEDRIYLRLKGEVGTPVSDTFRKIARYLGDRGYSITDYSKGYATDSAGKQQFKIGKLLKDNSELYQGFMDDSTRTLSTMFAVISRNATDIANMSTGRAWSSCMGSGGFNWRYVPKDIQAGSLVAYMVSEKDPDIVNPLARILIKPFDEVQKKTGPLTSAARKVFKKRKVSQQIFIPDKAYGIHNDFFSATVTKFVEDNLNAGKSGKFKLAKGLYQDAVPRMQKRKDGKIIETQRW